LSIWWQTEAIVNLVACANPAFLFFRAQMQGLVASRMVKESQKCRGSLVEDYRFRK